MLEHQNKKCDSTVQKYAKYGHWFRVCSAPTWIPIISSFFFTFFRDMFNIESSISMCGAFWT